MLFRNCGNGTVWNGLKMLRTDMEEEWRTVEENPLYQVSNLGKVRVIERTQKCGKNGRSYRTYPSQIMSTFLHDNGKGNKNVVVQMRDGKKQIRRSVAKLVLLAFVGKPPKMAKQPIHIDGNPFNNCLSNLKWDVDKSYYLPINERARELFYTYAYRFIKAYIRMKNIKHIIFLFLEKDDFMQECAIRIWNVIDCYDESHCSFKRFVFIKCEWVFKKMYKKYARRREIAPMKNIESEMVTEDTPLDYIKELSYEEHFYGND